MSYPNLIIFITILFVSAFFWNNLFELTISTSRNIQWFDDIYIDIVLLLHQQKSYNMFLASIFMLVHALMCEICEVWGAICAVAYYSFYVKWYEDKEKEMSVLPNCSGM